MVRIKSEIILSIKYLTYFFSYHKHIALNIVCFIFVIFASFLYCPLLWLSFALTYDRIFLAKKSDNNCSCNTLKGDNSKGSNTEKKQRSMEQNQYKRWSTEVKSDNFCYRKVGRVITLWGAIENWSVWNEQKIISIFWWTNFFFAEYNDTKCCKKYNLINHHCKFFAHGKNVLVIWRFKTRIF